jgi:hypothetical protein
VIAEYFPSVARPATSAEKTSLAGYVKVQLELARDGGFRTLEPELEAFLHRLNSSQSVVSPFFSVGQGLTRTSSPPPNVTR